MIFIIKCHTTRYGTRFPYRDLGQWASHGLARIAAAFVRPFQDPRQSCSSVDVELASTVTNFNKRQQQNTKQMAAESGASLTDETKLKMNNQYKLLGAGAGNWLPAATFCCLLLFTGIKLVVSETTTTTATYTVPNPFKELNGENANNFYYIRYSQKERGFRMFVKEYFSLGLGVSYSYFEDLEGSNDPWLMLVDGRAGQSYIVRGFDAKKNYGKEAPECELDHLHSHKKLYPWQYVYDLSEPIKSTGGEQVDTGSSIGMLPELAEENRSESKSKKKNKKKNKRSKRPRKVSFYGVGAIWLNLIGADVRSDKVGPNSDSHDGLTNTWQLQTKDLDVCMTFRIPSSDKNHKWTGDYATDQKFLDHTMPAAIDINADILYSNSSSRRTDEFILIDLFVADGKEGEEYFEQLKQFRLMLELCKKTNKRRRQFPNLMRALTSSPERAYKIDYVTHRYDFYPDGKLNGKYNRDHRRFLWEYELTSEVLSLAHDTQTIIYGSGFLEQQAEKPNGKRIDLFMARFTENASGKSARHATGYYHLMLYDEKLDVSCIRDERELKPEYRLFSSPFMFKTAKGTEYEGHIHGLGALLLNVATHMHYKSFSLSEFTIEVPYGPEDLSNGREVRVDVWQAIDERDKVRVLFYFEKRNPKSEPYQWDLAERDRADLARLVRVDVRTYDPKDDTTIKLDKSIIECEIDNMLAKYFIFNLDFELPDDERSVFLEVPMACTGTDATKLPPDDQPDSSDEDENPFEDTASNYDGKVYHDEDNDADDDATDSDDEDYDGENEKNADMIEQFEQFEGFERSEVPLPDLTAMPDFDSSYTIVTRLELSTHEDFGGGEPHKAIWLSESMNLATEQLSMSVFLSRDHLERNIPDDQYFLAYESELVFHLDKHRSCLRIDDVDMKWLRLFSGHLPYYTVIPTKAGQGATSIYKLKVAKLDKEDLVIKSNRLSTYGLGAMWRRAAESQLASYLGVRKERLERNGRKYKQLVWLYEELDMDIRWTFLLEEDNGGNANSGSTSRGLVAAQGKPQLESVLISEKYLPNSDESQFDDTQFKQVKATVEQINLRPASVLSVPVECMEQLDKAQQTIHYDQEIKPPSVEQVLGASKTYELQYAIYTRLYHGVREDEQQQASPSARLGLTKSNRIFVRESMDRELNRAKIVFEEFDPIKETTVYIDGQSKRMFLMNEHLAKCSHLTQTEFTLDSVLSVLVAGPNPDYNPDELYGLLGLWKSASKHQAKLRVRQEYDYLGALQEDQTYSIVSDGDNGQGLERKEARLSFKKSQPIDYLARSFDPEKKVRIRPEHDFELKQILLRHIKQMGEHNENYHDVRFSISLARTRLSDEWSLPEACQKLMEPADGSGATKPLENELQFPKLSELLQRSSGYHMRSEINIRGDLDTIYLIDELYNQGDVRIKTRSIGKTKVEKNCDLLMFADTHNQFDLSEPLVCKRLFDNKKSYCLSTNLLYTWQGGAAHIDPLASLHYGPLTLWKLAERGAPLGISAKLIKTVDLPSAIWSRNGDRSEETFKQQLEHEMNREVWLIRGTINGEPSGWSYEMRFVKQKRPIVLDDGRQGLEDWHVLEGVTAYEIDKKGAKFFVNIEVINYNSYEPNDATFRALFLLPDGWNCRRKAIIDDQMKPFMLNLQPLINIQVGYEASLEVVDASKKRLSEVYEDDELGPLRVWVPEEKMQQLPKLAGNYLTGVDLIGATNNSGLGLSMHQSAIRFSDGTTRLRRIVNDRDGALEHELDQVSGSCTIQTGATNAAWRLRFPADNYDSQVYTINMLSSAGPISGDKLTDKDLFKLMFVDDYKQFFLVNKYVAQYGMYRVLYATYEREIKHLTLTTELEGPARVVRRYEQVLDRVEAGSQGQQKTVQLVDFMFARIYLLSSDEKTVRAILSMQLQLQPSPTLSQFLELAGVTDCHNKADPLGQRQFARFTLEYPLADQYNTGLVMTHSSISILKENFYATLLRTKDANLLPLQLDGRAHLEFAEHGQTLRLHFNVLEAPSAMVYFSRLYHSAMNEHIEAIAELRIMPSEAACSHWCDQINCITMSYCDDRQCRVATRAGILDGLETTIKTAKQRRDAASTKQLDAKILALLESSVYHETCTYYYNRAPSGLRPRTLASLRSWLDDIVNKRARKELLEELCLSPDSMSFGLSLIHNNRLEPAKFYESSDLFRRQQDDNEVPFPIDDKFNPNIGGATTSFAVWKQASRLDLSKIDSLNEKLKLGHDSKFIVSWSPGSGKAGCLEECRRNKCLFVQTCSPYTRCDMVSATGSKSILSLGALKSELVVAETSPKCSIAIRSHLDKFNLFESTLKPEKFWLRLDDYSAQECAAACYLNPSECLAFDMCTYSDPIGPPRQSRSICFLQHDHIVQDSFDRSVLLPSWDIGDTGESASTRNTIDGRQVDCAHYSRSVLAEFRQVPSARLKATPGLRVQGISVDRCAIDCLKDDACQAFEHCLSSNLDLYYGGCYLIRRSTTGNDNDPDTGDWLDGLGEQLGDSSEATNTSIDSLAKYLRDQLKPSALCSIYVADRALMADRLDKTLSIGEQHDSSQPQSSRSSLVWISMGFLFALMLGAILQLLYTKVIGRPLSLRPTAAYR